MFTTTGLRHRHGQLLLFATLLGLLTTTLASISPRASNTSTIVPPNQNPGASGRVRFYGFRLNELYPGNYEPDQQRSPWTLELNLTRNVARPTFPEGNVSRITAEIIPPPPGAYDSPFQAHGSWNGDDAASSSWRLSLLMYPLDQMPAVLDGNDASGGGCPATVFSEQCKADMRRRIVSDPRVLSGEGTPLSNMYDSCGALNPFASYSFAMNAHFFRDTMQVWQVPMSKMDAYNIYGVRTFPFVLIWGHSNTTAKGAPLPDDHVQFLCVKADVSHPPATMPTGNSAERILVKSGVALYFAGLVGVLMAMYAL
ncbi:hypothetical protein MN608_10878 [Microdochium nivale]|nr:hypothetical protein MN608_10878 [Microdochium nivale]